MASSAASTFGPRDIYRSFRAERNVALHRVLKRLPDQFIVALIEGLEQADVITPGQLFAGERGGCAVGVTLRVLFPKYRGRRRLRGRRLHRSVMRLRRELAYEVSHLFALEQVFDRSVLLLQERFSEVPPQDVAKATALWIAGEARTELVLREMNSDWLAGTLSQPEPEPDLDPLPRVVDQELHVSVLDAALAAWASPTGAPA
ncbi:MAG TPA: hypothetical protein VHF58_09885 [Solirubrobacterales bacterium]|nr:hypothetical protein [Solirubrobacterales bacterium]